MKILSIKNWIDRRTILDIQLDEAELIKLDGETVIYEDIELKIKVVVEDKSEDATD